MLQLYGFYSVGGYKDMYFGAVNAESTSVYFLPLLPIMKKRERPEEINKVQYQDSLQKIEIITKSNPCGFPSECNALFSHGGYVLLYKTLHDGRPCLAIRNLYSTLKDEEGRTTPFNLLLIADSEESIDHLDNLAIFCVGNSEKLNDIISPTIQYDQHVNGLRADIFKLYEWIMSCPKSRRLCHYPGEINYLMVGSPSSLKMAISEQDINIDSVDAVFIPNGKIVYGNLKFKSTDSYNLRPSIEILEKEIVIPEDSKVDDIMEADTTDSNVHISPTDHTAIIEIKKINNDEDITEAKKESVVDMATSSSIEYTFPEIEDNEQCESEEVTKEDPIIVSGKEFLSVESPTLRNERNEIELQDILENKLAIKVPSIINEATPVDDQVESQKIIENVIEEDKQDIKQQVPVTSEDDNLTLRSLDSPQKTNNEQGLEKEIDDKVLVLGYYVPQYMVKWLIAASFGIGLIIGLII